MARRVVLVLAYLGIAALWQWVLWTALPNVGMGGLAVVWIIWPLLVMSGVGLWFLVARSGRLAVPVFAAVTVAMMVVTLVLHPQDDVTSVRGKIAVIVSRGAPG